MKRQVWHCLKMQYFLYSVLGEVCGLANSSEYAYTKRVSGRLHFLDCRNKF